VPIKLIDHNSPEYNQAVSLRYELLREPLGLIFTNEDLASESENLHIAAYDEDELIGCCMLEPLSPEVLKLRQMAVRGSLQGKGIGRHILQFAENIAMDKGVKTMRMNARKTAVDFYKKCGYIVSSGEFMEVNLPHFVMEKQLF
jgi:predicted GNAT family N-acyltransferase